MVSITDVAKEANVSVGSVSNFLNGKKLRSGNEDAIKAAIEKLGYEQNYIAKGLKRNKSFSVGVLTGDISSRWSIDIATSIEHTLDASGYSMVLGINGDNLDNTKYKIKKMINRSIDGLILFEPQISLKKISEIVDFDIPVISINGFDLNNKIDNVFVNDFDSVVEVLEKMIANNNEKIGVIIAPQRDYSSRERYRAVKDVQKRHPEIEISVYEGDYSRRSGYNGAKELIEENISSLLICSFNMSIGAKEFVNVHNQNRASKIKLAYFDYIDDSEYGINDDIIIEQPADEIGTQSTNLLLSKINQKNLGNSQTIVLKNKIVGI